MPLTGVSHHAAASGMRRFLLVCTWASCSTMAAVILWVPLGATGHALGRSGPWAIAPIAFLFTFYSAFVAPRVVLFGTPALIVLFGLWSWLCLRCPALDSWRGLSALAAVVALPGSYLAGLVSARCGDEFSFIEFVAYVFILWGAVISPRWLIPTIEVGAFRP